VSPRRASGEKVDRPSQILDAVLALLAREGIAGVSMRAVSREAGVALGLVHYYFDGTS
jgi:AcrR family transcriptional regulator